MFLTLSMSGWGLLPFGNGLAPSWRRSCSLSLWERVGVRAPGGRCRTLLLIRGRSRGVVPAAESLSFVSPKESNQRKGDPTGRVPPLRCGQPAVLAFRGVRANSLRSNTRGPDPRKAPLLGAARGEFGSNAPWRVLLWNADWRELRVLACRHARAYARTRTRTRTRTRAHAHAHAHACANIPGLAQRGRW